MCTYFKIETEDHSIGKTLSETSNIGARGQFLKRRNLCLHDLTKQQKQPLVIILQLTNFCNIFILCHWLRIIRRSDQGVQFTNFPSQILFKDINHGYKAALLKKNSLWLLFFVWMWLFIAIMKRCAERCALQFYCTSLKLTSHSILHYSWKLTSHSILHYSWQRIY